MIGVVFSIYMFIHHLLAYQYTDEIYAQVIKNRPDLKEQYARYVSYTIALASIRHNIPGNIYAAILMQESKYKTGIVNKTKDYGISQINHRTIKAYKFNKQLLLTDVEYSINAGARILSELRSRYSSREDNWWSRYHSNKNYLRNKYENLVNRYL